MHASIPPVRVGTRRIGSGEPLFFIAEIGLNHNQDFDMAKQLIDVAAQAGCSAAKFQTFRARDVYIGRNLAGTYHLMGKEIPIYDLHASLEMPEDWVIKLSEYCTKLDIVFFSAPIGQAATEMLLSAGTSVFKISSYECSNLPFVRYVASKGKPIILSTGAATLGEIEAAVLTIQRAGVPLAVMHCLTCYPASFRCANLSVMDTLRSAFEIPVGFSDNGFAYESGKIDDTRVPLAAAQGGADLFEIHITLDRSLPGPDHGFATEPDELKKMVTAMNSVRQEYNDGRRFDIDLELWGSSVKRTYPEEEYVRTFAYKCLFAAKDIDSGKKLTEDNVCILRPGEHPRGIEPKFYDLLIGKAVSKHKLKRWEPITWDAILS